MDNKKIEFYCKHCKKSMKVRYIPSGNPDALVLSGIEMACHTRKCIRVITLKRVTEGDILAHTGKDGKVFI